MYYAPNRLVAFLVLFLFIPLLSASSTSYDVFFTQDKFKELWEYSDKPVLEITGLGRGYTWGPASLGSYQEDYLEAGGGKRQVQYFVKSRMELSPNGSFITNGLLTKELVSGLRQDGDNKFTQLEPCQIQIAGDDKAYGNGIAPTYANFSKVISFVPGENTASPKIGQAANLSINNAGLVSSLSDPPEQVPIAFYDNKLGHNVPSVFNAYQFSTGLVWNGSGYIKGQIFTDNPVGNVFGYPISEPYWIKAVVGGIEKNILVQLFERRVLTYTPSNPDPFKVEMGNVGSHYYQWRYDGVGIYDKFELTFNVNVPFSNPYDPNDIQVDGYFQTPSKQTLIQPAFYFQDFNDDLTPKGKPVWKIRFSPSEKGNYQYYVKVNARIGSFQLNPGSFKAIETNNPGFIRVSDKNNRYFAFDNGKPFIGVGLNIAFTPGNNIIETYNRYFTNMQNNGANFARVWVIAGLKEQNSDWVMAIQSKALGANYSQTEAWTLDKVIKLAESKGIYLDLTFDDVVQYDAGHWKDQNL